MFKRIIKVSLLIITGLFFIFVGLLIAGMPSLNNLLAFIPVGIGSVLFSLGILDLRSPRQTREDIEDE